MNRLPGLLIVVDTKKEKIAVSEAERLGIPVCAVLDTNCDPDPITYPIPGNDDAIRSIKLILSNITEGIIEGMQLRVDQDVHAQKEAGDFEGEDGKGRRRGGLGGDDDFIAGESEEDRKRRKRKIRDAAESESADRSSRTAQRPRPQKRRDGEGRSKGPGL